MRVLLEATFWISTFLVAWTYAGYPLAAAALALLRRRKVNRAPCTPFVSVVYVARHRDSALEIRIREVLATDYPEDRLEVLVAPAGAQGRLPELIARCDDPRVRLIDAPGRGWAAARNAATAAARGEVLVFPDSRAVLHPEALRKLVRPFADAEVGAACGNRVLLRTQGEDPSLGAERLYADWDKWLAAIETRAGSLASVGRTLWAVRRDLVPPVREGRNPDFAVSAAVAARGFRIVWEPRALCYERGGDAAHRFQRRVRTVRGNLRTVADHPGLLNPGRHGFRAVTLLSHAVLRWLAPVPVAAAAVAAALLARALPGYGFVAAALPAWIALAVLGWAARATRWGKAPWASVPLFVCLGWAATIVALATVRRRLPRAAAAHAQVSLRS